MYFKWVKCVQTKQYDMNESLSWFNYNKYLNLKKIYLKEGKWINLDIHNPKQFMVISFYFKL